MKLGDKVLRPTEALFDMAGKHQSTAKTAPGVVVYIHPALRFHIVEFTFPGGKFREGFPGV